MDRFVLLNVTQKKTWGMYQSLHEARLGVASHVAAGELWTIFELPETKIGSGKPVEEGIGPI